MPVELSQVFWIGQGDLVKRPVGPSGEALTDRVLLQQRELVKIEANENGTTISWVMFAANWTSLYFANEWIGPLEAPFTLNYFNSGWFSESFDDLDEVRKRIIQLMGKSDIRFSQRTYTQRFEPDENLMSPAIKKAWSQGFVSQEKAVVCSIDVDRELTQVEEVGSDSALASVWGVSPVSYPCLSGHSYDRVVSRSYYEVVKTEKPIYDHVLAAMACPDGSVKWLGYQRLIFPRKTLPDTLPQVTVACEFDRVGIQLL